MDMRRISLLMVGVLLLAGCGAEPGFNHKDTKTPRGAGQGERVRVVTTIGVLADWARQVGGDRVEVACLLSGSESPHTYELKPADVKLMADARVLFRVGLGLEEWLDAAIENSGNKRLVVVDAIAGITDVIADEGHQPNSEARASEAGIHHKDTKTPRVSGEGDEARAEARSETAERSRDQGTEGSSGRPQAMAEAGTAESPAPSPRPLTPTSGNPHVWLDPEYAKVGIGNLVKELVRLDPPGESLYRRREAAYLARLDSLSAAIAAEFAGLKERRLITYHDAWPYFARRFGLDIVASVEPIPGQEPSAKELARLVDLIRAEHIKVITTEPQLPSALPEMLAKETGVKVLVLNPLLVGPDGAVDYVRELGASAGVLAGALK